MLKLRKEETCELQWRRLPGVIISVPAPRLLITATPSAAVTKADL